MKAPNPIVLARGNNKINKALIWNLPDRVTCPGATELCKQICYARDSAIRYKNVVPQSRAKHFTIAQRPDFRELMINKLKCSRLPRMRIHESGDFYNQKYLDDWVAIINQFPERTFWAYTKSWMLDFSVALKLPNLFLRYSIDATTLHFPKQVMPYAVVSANRKDYFICPATLVKGHSIQCMKDCSFCRENKESLIFRPHGSKKKRVGEIETRIRPDLK